MKTVKLPKFEWSRIDEHNAGHTKEEWGNQNSKPSIIKAYDLSWNMDEDSILLEKILSNASYVYITNETDDDLQDQE